MTLNDAVALVLQAAREAGYDEYEVRSLSSDVREMLYDIDNLTNDDVQNFIEQHV